jgi:hypothetical protein
MNSIYEAFLELWMCMGGKSILRAVMRGGAILRDAWLPFDNLKELEQVNDIFLDAYA